MSKFFYNMCFNIGCNKIGSVWNKIISYLLNILFPIYCRMFKIKSGVSEDDKNIIVSLTSFPERMGKIHLCIESIMRQSLKPNRIILWLVESECNDKKIPESLIELKKKGLEIMFCKENLKPHNKLYHTMKKYSDSIIITVDDDIIYPSNLIEKLYTTYINNKCCIVCNMAHEITLDKNNKPNPYNLWNGGAIGKGGPSHLLAALGVGGVLYPPRCFDNEYFNKELIKKLSLTADDLWLKFSEVRNDIKVVKVDKNAKNPITIKKSQSVALTKLNNGEGKNNIILDKLNDYLNIDWSLLK